MADSSVNALIATGCPNSGWEMVIPALQQAGIQLLGEEFEQWHEQVFEAGRGADPSSLDPAYAENAAVLFEQASSDPILGADSRSLRLIDFWAEHLPEARFLLFFTPVETALAHALRHGHDPRQVLKDWQTANRQLIRFQRHNRQRAVLVDAQAASRFPKGLVDVCRRIGIEIEAADTAELAAKGELLLERLIARQLLVGQIAVESLQDELNASAPPLGVESAQVSLDSEEILAQYQQRQVAEAALRKRLEQQYRVTQALETDFADAAEENELLMLQLHQVQEELEHYFLKYQGLVQADRGDQAQTVRQQQRDLAATGAPIPSSDTSPADAHPRPRRLSRKEKRRLKKDVELLKASSLFDGPWYLEQYPDVAQAGVDPVQHFLRFGAGEGRNPSPAFDTAFYLESYPDVEASGVNPLIHFIRFGRDEGRVASRWGAAG